jgi:hypothetical protein
MIDRRALLLTSLSAIAVGGLAAACRSPMQTDSPDGEFFLRENSPPEEIVPKLMVDTLPLGLYRVSGWAHHAGHAVQYIIVAQPNHPRMLRKHFKCIDHIGYSPVGCDSVADFPIPA